MNHSKTLVLLGAIGYAVCLVADFILEIVNGVRLEMNTFTNFQEFLHQKSIFCRIYMAQL